jgi:hypothetical protein
MLEQRRSPQHRDKTCFGPGLGEQGRGLSRRRFEWLESLVLSDVRRARCRERGASAPSALPLRRLEPQEQCFHVFSRPGGSAQECEARAEARLVSEATNWNSPPQLRPAVVPVQPFDDLLQGDAVQRVVRVRARRGRRRARLAGNGCFVVGWLWHELERSSRQPRPPRFAQRHDARPVRCHGRLAPGPPFLGPHSQAQRPSVRGRPAALEKRARRRVDSGPRCVR